MASSVNNTQRGSKPLSLHVATQANDDATVKKLIQTGADLNLLGDHGEAPLHLACRLGYADIVEALLNADVDVRAPDQYGWTAIEYATFYGHLRLASRLAQLQRSSRATWKQDVPFSTSPPHIATTKPWKTQQLRDRSMILLTPGLMSQASQSPVQLDPAWLETSRYQQKDLVIRPHASPADDQEGTPDDDCPEQAFNVRPVTFYTQEPTKVQFSCDLLSSNTLLARGTIQLSNATPNLGPGMAPLTQSLHIPLLEPNTVHPIGHITYTYLIITPFTHPSLSTNPSQQPHWPQTPKAPILIGHRGNGKNTTDTTHLQLGENTIPSFLQAHKHGATWVEFDVQVTKDLVPIIYHDYLVSETGVDAPVHALTAEQFLHLKDVETAHLPPPSPTRPRSHSTTASTNISNPSLYTRMRHTLPFSRFKFKSNARDGNQIASPHASLADLFTALPVELSFNIEIKYPQAQEFAHDGITPTHLELNTFIDSILKIVFDGNNNNRRNLYFSSFNPAVCIALSLKQKTFPVMFLTLAGAYQLHDTRCNSLSAAVQFAREWDLMGVVPLALPLVLAPRLTGVIHDQGLRVVSWGKENCDVDKVGVQVKEGVDGVITDEVLKIYRALQGGAR